MLWLLDALLFIAILVVVIDIIHTRPKKFVCDSCRNKSLLQDGFTRIPIDVDVQDGKGTFLLPINLVLCKTCLHD